MQNIFQYKCDICGAAAANTVYHLEEELLLCHNCSSQLHTCRGCSKRGDCVLELNPLDLPLYVVKTQQTPRGVMQMQVPNPDLINTYCPECICSCGDIMATECMRKMCGICENWELHEEYKRKD